MRIEKILNQNAVLVDDDGSEKVAIGKGIGFNNKRQDDIDSKDIERLFVLEPEGQVKLQNLLKQIDEKYLFLAEHIIAHAEMVLMEKLNEYLLIILTDHLAFASENISKGIFVRNKLLKEIETLYPEEFEIAQWAVDYLSQELNLPFSYDEAGYIAVHIHSSRKDKQNSHRSIREVSIISDVMTTIENKLSIDLRSEEMAIHYSRLVNHLRLLLQRYSSQNYVSLDMEIVEVVKKKYADSYQIAKEIRVLLSKNYQVSITAEELGYLAIHIERLRLAKNNI